MPAMAGGPSLGGAAPALAAGMELLVVPLLAASVVMEAMEGNKAQAPGAKMLTAIVLGIGVGAALEAGAGPKS